MRRIIREIQTMTAINLKETSGIHDHWTVKELKNGQIYFMQDGHIDFIEFLRTK